MFLAMIIFISGCSLTSYVGYRIAPDYPRNTNKTLQIKGLHHVVKAYFDAWGVPHIQAGDTHDMLMAVGYLQGRDRFFEMDILRRIAQGRMSELVGKQELAGGTTVDFDLAMKGWAIEGLAKKDVATMSSEAKSLMNAYVAGVNMAIKADKPLEYRMLRVEPQPWTLTDSMAVGRLTAWSITHNWSQEATRLILALYDGLDAAKRIWPATPLPNNASLKTDGPAHALPPSVVPELAAMFPGHKKALVTKRTIAMPFFSGASNAWAVGGGLTQSGMPIVASDPHLIHLAPSFMYQEHLSWNGRDVIGAAVPGIPFIVAGHNRDVAWGLTSTVADIVDLCIEKTRVKDGKTEVLNTEGKWVPIQRKKFVVRVRKNKKYTSEVFYIRHTQNGPAFNDMYPGVLPSWAPLVTIRTDKRPIGDSIFALEKMAGAQTVMELRAALKTMDAPVNTYLAGDRQGNIALFVAGRVPIRKTYRGTFPVPGWLKKYQWDRSIPYSDMPHGLAKGKRFFVNANNMSVDPRYSKFIVNVDSAPSYRFQRITDLLSGKGQQTIETSKAVQMDQYLMRARLLMPILLKDLDGMKLTEIEGNALKILKNWDYIAGREAVAPTIFFAIYRFVAMHALAAQLDPGAFHFVMTRRYTANFIDLAIQDADNPLWDNPGTTKHEKRTDVIRKAFAQAVGFLKKRLGDDPDKWQWGKMHYIEIGHAFGAKKAIAKHFNMPRTQLGGGMDSVWKTHFDMADERHPFKVTAGPVWRMVVDLGDINHARWVLDTGESGWSGSPHYKDQFKQWVRGKYIPMTIDWKAIRSSAKGLWTLTPEQATKK